LSEAREKLLSDDSTEQEYEMVTEQDQLFRILAIDCLLDTDLVKVHGKMVQAWGFGPGTPVEALRWLLDDAGSPWRLAGSHSFDDVDPRSRMFALPLLKAWHTNGIQLRAKTWEYLVYLCFNDDTFEPRGYDSPRLLRAQGSLPNVAFMAIETYLDSSDKDERYGAVALLFSMQAELPHRLLRKMFFMADKDCDKDVRIFTACSLAESTKANLSQCDWQRLEDNFSSWFEEGSELYESQRYDLHKSLWNRAERGLHFSDGFFENLCSLADENDRASGAELLCKFGDASLPRILERIIGLLHDSKYFVRLASINGLIARNNISASLLHELLRVYRSGLPPNPEIWSSCEWLFNADEEGKSKAITLINHSQDRASVVFLNNGNCSSSLDSSTPSNSDGDYVYFLRQYLLVNTCWNSPGLIKTLIPELESILKEDDENIRGLAIKLLDMYGSKEVLSENTLDYLTEYFYQNHRRFGFWKSMTPDMPNSLSSKKVPSSLLKHRGFFQRAIDLVGADLRHMLAYWLNEEREAADFACYIWDNCLCIRRGEQEMRIPLGDKENDFRKRIAEARKWWMFPGY
jgi:hypothetical protein